MAKVDEELVGYAAAMIKEENIVEFSQFIRSRFPVMDYDHVTDNVQRMVDMGQIDRAVRLWMHVARGHNPTRDSVVGVLRLLLKAFWYVGAVGGWVFLVWGLMKVVFHG